MQIVENIGSLEPDINKANPLGFLSLGHGTTTFLNKVKNLNFLSVLETPQGTLRGNHYHRERSEYLYILKGKMVGYFWNPFDASEKFETILREGDLVTINPNLAHAIKPLEHNISVEFSEQAFNIKDYFYVDNPFGSL